MAVIIKKIKVSKDYYLISLSHKMDIEPKPGQFYMLRCGMGTDPLLPRPLSIHNYLANLPENSTQLDFLFQVVGVGTNFLSRMREGDEIELFGPLGNGFDLSKPIEHTLFIAGGIGIAPLPYLFERLSESDALHSARLLFGTTTASQIPPLERFKRHTCDITLYTEDGSLGEKGLVTKHIESILEFYTKKNAVVFACGPQGMLSRIARECSIRQIPCQVSLDRRMACGVGACMGCVVKGSKQKSGGQKGIYERVCKEGPVFHAEDILWSE